MSAFRARRLRRAFESHEQLHQRDFITQERRTQEMTTYYDALNDFYKLNEQEPLAPAAQLVYLHLLHRNNRLGNRGLVQVSDRALETMTGLAKQSVTRAKQSLKNRGLIDFKTDKTNPRPSPSISSL